MSKKLFAVVNACDPYFHGFEREARFLSLRSRFGREWPLSDNCTLIIPEILRTESLGAAVFREFKVDKTASGVYIVLQDFDFTDIFELKNVVINFKHTKDPYKEDYHKAAYFYVSMLARPIVFSIHDITGLSVEDCKATNYLTNAGILTEPSESYPPTRDIKIDDGSPYLISKKLKFLDQ